MTAGYSGTPLARKLGIRPGHIVELLGAPAGWAVPDLPAGVRVRRRRGPDPDVVLAFCRAPGDVDRCAATEPTRLAAAGALWLVWPRRAGGHQSDVTEHLLREVVLPTGLVDTKVAALDADWSALRFVRRVRPAGRGRCS